MRVGKGRGFNGGLEGYDDESSDGVFCGYVVNCDENCIWEQSQQQQSQSQL
jgi:hypothetical protein